MGFVLSKFRKKNSTYEVLEALEAEITSIIKLKANIVVWHNKVVGYFVTFSMVLFLFRAIFVYFKFFPAVSSKMNQVLLLAAFLVFPGLIWLLMKLLTWWCNRKVRQKDMKLDQLKDKKRKILDGVLEKETYKVAKQILNRFGQNQRDVMRPSVPLEDIKEKQPSEDHVKTTSQLRRRHTALAETSASSLIASALSTTLTSSRSPAGGANSPALSPSQGPSASATPHLVPQSTCPPAPGPPLPRPLQPLNSIERGYLDKFVEFLVGDNPASRFALICRQCKSHNGMALGEEFEYLAYRCCYCYYWNPACKDRPGAPKPPGGDCAVYSDQQINRETVGEVDNAKADSEITEAKIVKHASDSADDAEQAPRAKNEGSNMEVLIKGNIEKVGKTQSEIMAEESKPITSHEEDATKNIVHHDYEKKELGLSWAKLRMSFRFS